MQRLFHHPFYAGWGVSDRFGIKIGEVKGQWEPIITSEEFERGKAILPKHGNYKRNFQKQFYLLRNLLWVQVGDKKHKMFGSTPSGKCKSYSYYLTHTKIEGCKFRIQTKFVDAHPSYYIHGTGLMEGGSFVWLNEKTAVVSIGHRSNHEGARQLGEVLKTMGVELLCVDNTGYGLHIDGSFVMVKPDLAVSLADSGNHWSQ